MFRIIEKKTLITVDTLYRWIKRSCMINMVQHYAEVDVDNNVFTFCQSL